MKYSSLRSLAIFVAIAGSALAVQAQQFNQYATILQQPLDQCVAVGDTAVFSVVATNATSYQWLFNGTAVDGATNSSFEVPDVAIGNVGLYSAFVYDGSEAVPTRSAALDVYMAPTSPAPSGGTPLMSSSAAMASPGFSGAQMDDLLGPPIVVFGAPVVSRGGTGSGCPGKYSGYVNFLPPTGWGFLPDTNTTVYTATDTNQTITKVEYVGCYGDNACAQTSETVPYPAMSPQYRFSIYFPTNCAVPTNAYPITLSGFNP